MSIHIKEVSNFSGHSAPFLSIQSYAVEECSSKKIVATKGHSQQRSLLKLNERF